MYLVIITDEITKEVEYKIFKIEWNAKETIARDYNPRHTNGRFTTEIVEVDLEDPST